MRERLPKLAEVFKAGDIDQRTFATIVYRTDLITDSDVLATVDEQLAVTVPRWPSMTRGRLAGQIDKIVAKVDADAVRQRKERRAEREVWFARSRRWTIADPRQHADSRSARLGRTVLTALARTVCEHDPRTHEQRRADALGGLAAGVDRLVCRCGRDECVAEKRPAATSVVIHVIAGQATTAATASEVCADGLIGPELVAELAAGARLVPLIHPLDAAPEPGYVPSSEPRRLRPMPRFDLSLARLRSPGVRLRRRPHRPFRRRRTDSRVEPEVLLPHSSSRQDLLGLARSAIARRHSHSHLARGQMPTSRPRAAPCSFPACATDR